MDFSRLAHDSGDSKRWEEDERMTTINGAYSPQYILTNPTSPQKEMNNATSLSFSETLNLTKNNNPDWKAVMETPDTLEYHWAQMYADGILSKTELISTLAYQYYFSPINDTVTKEDFLSLGRGTFLIHFEMQGVDTSQEINWGADGSHKLTNEEKAYLNKKYDINNLSPQDMYNLLQELTSMNAISGDDLAASQVNYTPPYDVDKLRKDPSVIWFEVDPVTGHVCSILVKKSDEENEMRKRIPKIMGDNLVDYLLDMIERNQYEYNSPRRVQDETGAEILKSQKNLLELLQSISAASE